MCLRPAHLSVRAPPQGGAWLQRLLRTLSLVPPQPSALAARQGASVIKHLIRICCASIMGSGYVCMHELH